MMTKYSKFNLARHAKKRKKYERVRGFSWCRIQIACVDNNKKRTQKECRCSPVALFNVSLGCPSLHRLVAPSQCNENMRTKQGETKAKIFQEKRAGYALVERVAPDVVYCQRVKLP